MKQIFMEALIELIFHVLWESFQTWILKVQILAVYLNADAQIDWIYFWVYTETIRSYLCLC